MAFFLSLHVLHGHHASVLGLVITLETVLEAPCGFLCVAFELYPFFLLLKILIISGHFRSFLVILEPKCPPWTSCLRLTFSETTLEAPCGPLSVAFEFGIYTIFFFFGKLCKI